MRAAARGFAVVDRDLAAVERDVAAVERGLVAVERLAAVAARVAGRPRRRRARPASGRRAPRAAGAGGGGLGRRGLVLERGDAAGQRLDLRAQALEVLEHADVLDHLAHAAGGAGHLVDEVLGAGARGLGAVGGGLEGPLDGGAHRADRVGRRLSFLDFFLSFFAMSARSVVPCHPVASTPIHLRPNAAVAERALLPGDPGARCGWPSTCWPPRCRCSTRTAGCGATRARPPTARR